MNYPVNRNQSDGSPSQRAKASKGSVQLRSVKGRLRLVWSVLGERYFLSLELEDTPLARKVAEAKANLIEADIISGNFDSSLEKYKPESQKKSSLKVKELVASFLKHKEKQVSKRTMEKYRAFGGHLQQFFATRSVGDMDEAQAEKFRLDLMSKDLEPSTVRTILGFAQSCWEWAIAKQLVTDSPWAATQKLVKVPPKQKPKPFTKEEIQAIVQGFRGHRYYSHYSEFVEFRLDTGCRIAEAAGLKFKHISQDGTQVWIGETYSRGEWKPTKTNEARWVNLPKRARQIVAQRMQQEHQPGNVIFPGPRGVPIDDHTFSQRIWKAILAEVGVEFRVFYNTRHTVISQALEAGMSPTAIADQTGHRVETLLKHYAGNVQNRPRLPDLLDEEEEIS
jgi:integrase